jgi:hypothetical protein
MERLLWACAFFAIFLNQTGEHTAAKVPIIAGVTLSLTWVAMLIEEYADGIS